MPRTDLKAGSRFKYGIVRVLNQDGTINRSFRITAQELQALRSGGWPAGVGRTERWEAGGRACDVGEVEVTASGALRFKLGERLGTGIFEEDYIRLEKDEWSGTFPNITVAKTIIDKKDLSRTAVASIQSITNGTVQWLSR